MEAVVATLTCLTDLDEKVPGELTPKHPIKWAAYQALMNAHGRPVDVVIRIREDWYADEDSDAHPEGGRPGDGQGGLAGGPDLQGQDPVRG